ncbi:MAG TPA: phenylacetate--CoA ligase family protein, partial [Polyangiaceae bacterium]
MSARGFGEAPAKVRALPFVYVFGRSSFAISFYGANVYPENVSPALEARAFAPLVTGKFVMQVRHDDDQNAALEIAIELVGGASLEPELATRIAEEIRLELERLN